VHTGLVGKVAVVTGGAGGIGLACARMLAAEGAHVVLADLDEEGASRAAAQIGGACVGVCVDVTKPEECEALVNDAARQFEGPDVLVTCAGLFHSTPFDHITAEEWDRVQAVNLKGTFLTCQAALRVMIPRRRGRIVTIASLGGQTGGLAAGASYAASKAGVVALTKAMARYAGPYGITVNTVNPGLIDTAMTAMWPDDVKQRVLAQTPLGRMGTADEVAEIVCVLASDAARFVHGAHVDVNGGLLMD
jgi:3-oxoacyl-[acyl-carrier protein] reductase